MATHHFEVEDAIQCGVEKAVLLYNLRFWLDKVRANDNDRHKHDGYYWTYNSARAFGKLFPYYTERKIHRMLDQLESDGFIISGNYNKVAYDRTKWYTTPDFSICQKEDIHLPNMTNGITKSVEPIPNINPNSNPNVISNTITEEKPKPTKKKKRDIPSDFAATDKQIEKCNEYGINIQELISGFDDFHSSKGNQFVDWSKAFNTWINNHIKFERLKPIKQGDNNANRQSANSQRQQQPKQSSADIYAAKLAEQRRQREAANPTATRSNRANVYDMEENF